GRGLGSLPERCLVGETVGYAMAASTVSPGLLGLCLSLSDGALATPLQRRHGRIDDLPRIRVHVRLHISPGELPSLDLLRLKIGKTVHARQETQHLIHILGA